MVKVWETDAPGGEDLEELCESEGEESGEEREIGGERVRGGCGGCCLQVRRDVRHRQHFAHLLPTKLNNCLALVSYPRPHSTSLLLASLLMTQSTHMAFNSILYYILRLYIIIPSLLISHIFISLNNKFSQIYFFRN